jgi:hypothetical protein
MIDDKTIELLIHQALFNCADEPMEPYHTLSTIWLKRNVEIPVCFAKHFAKLIEEHLEKRIENDI